MKALSESLYYQFSYISSKRKFDGFFRFHGYLDDDGEVIDYEFSKTSLFCFTDENCLRRGLVWFMTWKWFENFITFAIVLNSLMLASTDYQIRLDPDHVSEWTPIQEKIDMGFSGLFIFESFVKIIAMGFVFHKKSYLRDAWNVLDFFIVCVSIVGFLPIEDGAESLKALRTFRILRPLRSINKLPSMKRQITVLLGSIPGLMRVFFFIIFIFTIFAIFGTNQFLGQQYQFCRATLEPEFDQNNQFVIWEKLGDDGDGPVLCFEDVDCEKAFPEALVAVCGTVYEAAGLDPNADGNDGIQDIELIMYGIPGFDNVAQGFLTIFQILTLESWVYLMYNYSDTGSGSISVIFFVLVVLIGSFFTMNLVLAIIVDQFDGVSNTDTSKELDKLQQSNKEDDSDEDAQGKSQKDGQYPDIGDEKNNAAITKPKIEEEKPGQKESFLGDLIQSIKQDKSKQLQTGDSTVSKNNPEQLSSKVVVENTDFTPPASQENLENLKTDQDFLDDDGKEYDETVEERRIRLALKERNSDSKCRKAFYDLVTSVSFNFFIFILIIGNTATLALYSYDQSERQEKILELFNEFFHWAFVIEMFLKLIGLGFSNYTKDSYNLFDALIVIISTVDWVIFRLTPIDAENAMKAFRALRLLRMIKLSRSWKALATILKNMLDTIKPLANFSMLLLLFMYIFALLGMELFANIALIDKDDELVVGVDQVQELYNSGEFYTFPRDNFNNVGWALTTVFIVIIGEDWNWTMYQWVRAYGSDSALSYHIAIFYFVLLIIFGNIVMFSLFTAVLLQSFETEEGEEEEEEAESQTAAEYNEEQTEQITLGQRCNQLAEDFKLSFGKRKRKDKNNSAEQEEEEVPKGDQNSDLKDGIGVDDDFSFVSAIHVELNQLDEETLKQKLQERQERKRQRREKRIFYERGGCSLTHYDLYERKLIDKKSTILDQENDEIPELMGTNTCCMGPKNCFRLMCQYIVESKIFQNTILLLIVVSTVTLAMETPLDDPESEKIEILGYIDLSMTYIFTLEMVIKITALGFAFSGKNSYIREPWNILDFLIVVSALFGIIAGDAVKVSFFKALRILKVLRPLRMISRHKGLKVAIIALGTSLPAIINLQIIVLFFIFLLAILQTTLFSGQFYSCSTDHLNLTMQQQVDGIKTMWDCINYGGEWVTPDLNYDTTLTSMLTLLTIQTTEGWIDVMWNSVDAVAPYSQPIENNNVPMVFYTMVMVIIICLLFIELFVGIVVQSFNNQKALLSGNQTLERVQQAWITVHLMAINSTPKIRFDASKFSPMRGKAIKLTENNAFDIFIMICILANTFVLGFNWYMQPKFYELPIEIVNYTFVVIFTIEAILKITAQGCYYFQDSWNLFDFMIVVLTIVILSLNFVGVGEKLEILGTVLRTLRIGRVFRLIKKQKKLNAIFITLIKAFPAIASLGLLLMLLIFMFAVIGLAQFSLIDLEGASEMNKHVNFQTFGAAFLTLVRCSTGEAWNSIMFDSSQTRSIFYQCEEDEDYYSIVERGDDPNDTYGPKGCGTSFATTFHLLFQVLVSQVFLNLFIAIIIDAFFGQTDIANIPVKEENIKGFQNIWSKYDHLATQIISIKDLQRLLIDLSHAGKDEAGTFAPFRKQLNADNNTENQQFIQRQLMALDIPTYNNQRDVMYYDVLLKMCHQSIKFYFQKHKLDAIMSQLRVIKAFGGRQLYDDQLAAIYYRNTYRKEKYDVEILQLIEIKLKEKNPRAELVQDLKQRTKEIKKTYNHKVDTNFSILGREKFKKVKNKLKSAKYELYTTKHLGSAKIIYDFFSAYIDRRGTITLQKAEIQEVVQEGIQEPIDQQQIQRQIEGKIKKQILEQEKERESSQFLTDSEGILLDPNKQYASIKPVNTQLEQQAEFKEAQISREAASLDDQNEENDVSEVPDQHFSNQRFF